MENLSSRCSWQDLKVTVDEFQFQLKKKLLSASLYNRRKCLAIASSVEVKFGLPLQDFMRQAGEVTYADAHKERANEGVIEFRSYSDLRRAVEKLDGTDINGRKIRLVEEKPRRRRSSSGSRSR